MEVVHGRQCMEVLHEVLHGGTAWRYCMGDSAWGTVHETIKGVVVRWPTLLLV